jgi:hypothetical protein
MLVVLKKDYAEVSREAARIVARAVRSKPDIVLGLATGSTPLGLYQELTALYRTDSLDFSRATSFNLDEYLGLGPCAPAKLPLLHGAEPFFSGEPPARTGAHSGRHDFWANTTTIARATSNPSRPPAESTCKSWASGATATSASTNQRPAWRPARA